MSGKLRRLPERQRCIYRQNPLIEVVAAVQFPTVLTLLNTAPAEFQKRIVKDYPVATYRESTVQMGAGSIHEPARQHVEQVKTPHYAFASSDGNWVISLEPTLTAITCNNYAYREWPEFRAKFVRLINEVLNMFSISQLNRVGLRYKDLIDRKRLGLAGVKWMDLFQQGVLDTFAYFADEVTGDFPMGASITLELPVGKVTVGIAAVENQQHDTALLFDTDCFVESPMPASADAVAKLADELHHYTGLVFRGSISDRLHEALVPQ